MFCLFFFFRLPIKLLNRDLVDFASFLAVQDVGSFIGLVHSWTAQVCLSMRSESAF